MSQPLVLPEVVASMLISFAPVFTKPSFDTFCDYVGALMLGEGRRTGAAIARTTAEAKSQGVHARLCSRARWSAAALLDQLWALLLSTLPFPRDAQGRLTIWTAIDDSVIAKTGKQIPGLAYHFHHNAGPDERAWPFLFGHCWVTLGVLWPTVNRALEVLSELAPTDRAKAPEALFALLAAEERTPPLLQFREAQLAQLSHLCERAVTHVSLPSDATLRSSEPTSLRSTSWGG